MPAQTYGVKTWTLAKRIVQRFQTTERGLERFIMTIIKRYRKMINMIKYQTKDFDIREKIKRLK